MQTSSTDGRMNPVHSCGCQIIVVSYSHMVPGRKPGCFFKVRGNEKLVLLPLSWSGCCCLLNRSMDNAFFQTV